MTKKSILFVDDEPNVLQGLRRMLRSMRDSWDIDTADDGEQALDKLANKPFDVIISDMRMPGMDGAQLLQTVRDRYPQIVRIVLSGQSDQESVLRAIGSTHQYISKPCDAETLKATIDRACALHQVLENEALRELVSKLKTVPSMPNLYLDVMREIRSPDPNIEKVGHIIGRDAGMTAKILQLVNSAFFGFFKSIQDPIRAVNVLGLDNIRSLIISIHIFSEFSEEELRKFDLSYLWRHNLEVAECAKALAKDANMPQSVVEESYMAGLLHDVGKLILMANLPDQFKAAIELAKCDRISINQAEQKVIGSTHGAIGGYLLGLWGLPASTIEAIAYHHHPEDFPDSAASPLTFVAIANELVLTAQEDSSHKQTWNVEAYLQSLNLASKLEAWREQCTKIIRKDETHE